jgi:hypothetical protein
VILSQDEIQLTSAVDVWQSEGDIKRTIMTLGE